MSKKSGCQFCYGLGIIKSWHDLGFRMPMPAGVRNKPRFPREAVIPCDRCGEPKKK